MAHVAVRLGRRLRARRLGDVGVFHGFVGAEVCGAVGGESHGNNNDDDVYCCCRLYMYVVDV